MEMIRDNISSKVPISQNTELLMFLGNGCWNKNFLAWLVGLRSVSGVNIAYSVAWSFHKNAALHKNFQRVILTPLVGLN